MQNKRHSVSLPNLILGILAQCSDSSSTFRQWCEVQNMSNAIASVV